MAWRSTFQRSTASVRTIERTPGFSRSMLGRLGIVSFTRGLAEAAVLVLVARVGVAVASDSSEISTNLGPLGHRLASIGEALALGVGLGVTMLVLHLVQSHLGAALSQRASSATRRRLATAFLEAGWSRQAEEPRGRLQETMSSSANQISAGARVLGQMMGLAFSLAALLLAALIVDPLLTVALVVLLAVASALLRPVTRPIRRRAAARREADERYALQFAETVGAAQELQAFGVGSAVADRLDADAESAGRASYRLHLLSNVAPGVYQTLALLTVLAGLWIVQTTDAGRADEIGALLLLLVRGIGFGHQLQTMTNRMTEIAPYVRQVSELVHSLSATRPQWGERHIQRIELVEFAGVSYSYPNGRRALTDVSFAFEAGTTIGVIGPSGGGKSTFAQLLLRLRLPDSGTCAINGHPSADYSVSDWGRTVAAVPQTAHVLRDTVAENIRFFRHELGADDIELAARAAHLHEEIRTLPDGYDTLIGGGSDMLSGGQAQRLCLARALAHSPSLLVLDEPTSALDLKSEALIQQTLAELAADSTVVIIAHRLSTLRLCDRLMVFEDGRLRAFDQPEALQADSSFYRDMLELSDLS